MNLYNYIYFRFDGCIGLELGEGLGLCSIVLGRMAKRLLSTGIHVLLI